MIKWIKNLIYFNRKMINALNSCKYDEFEFLFNCILAYNGKDFERFFTSKLYIWNVIRPRDFYKMCAMYIHRYTDKDCVIFDKVERLINIVLKTAKTEQIKKTFVWNITKTTPIIMWSMVPYMSEKRIINMLTKKKYVITDELMQPFFEVVNIIRNGEDEDISDDEDD